MTGRTRSVRAQYRPKHGNASQNRAYPATIRFTGRRVAANTRPSPQDSFDVCETVERVVPGSGRVAVTTRIFDLAPGEWHATATMLPVSA
jgi:phosphatidylglycerol---prolipoprotein diacylglyceryl transferase